MHREPGPHTSPNGFPQGLLGDTAKFLLDAAQYPQVVYAQAGALAIMAGVVGRAFTTPTTAGLNLYALIIGPTGSGKEIISGGMSKLFRAVQLGTPDGCPNVPGIMDFKGPGELVSGAGLIKALERKPCFISNVGELGKKLEIMVNPKAPIHEKTTYRTLLQLWAKSGEGEVYDPIAYSDRDKNTAPIDRPALTLVGESVPETFYEALGEWLITDGLLPRFLTFEAKGARPYRNKAADNCQPEQDLVEHWARLTAHCLDLNHRGVVQRVAWLAEAEAKFDEYERWTTDEINRATGEGSRQLWNRAYLKALKLASLAAVGDNYVNPQITLSHAVWATDLVATQTNALIARFANGDVGAVEGNENKQRDNVLKIMAGFFTSEAADPRIAALVRDMTITKSYIQQRISTLPAFKPKPTQALDVLLKSMTEADELREVPQSQMLERHGTKAKAYALFNMEILKPHLKL